MFVRTNAQITPWSCFTDIPSTVLGARWRASINKVRMKAIYCFVTPDNADIFVWTAKHIHQTLASARSLQNVPIKTLSLGIGVVLVEAWRINSSSPKQQDECSMYVRNLFNAICASRHLTKEDAQNTLVSMTCATLANDDDVMLGTLLDYINTHNECMVFANILLHECTHGSKRSLLDCAILYKARKCTMVLLKLGACSYFYMNMNMHNQRLLRRYNAWPGHNANMDREWFGTDNGNVLQIVHQTHVDAVRMFCAKIDIVFDMPAVLQRLVCEFADAYCDCMRARMKPLPPPPPPRRYSLRLRLHNKRRRLNNNDAP